MVCIEELNGTEIHYYGNIYPSCTVMDLRKGLNIKHKQDSVSGEFDVTPLSPHMCTGAILCIEGFIEVSTIGPSYFHCGWGYTGVVPSSLQTTNLGSMSTTPLAIQLNSTLSIGSDTDIHSKDRAIVAAMVASTIVALLLIVLMAALIVTGAIWIAKKRKTRNSQRNINFMDGTSEVSTQGSSLPIKEIFCLLFSWTYTVVDKSPIKVFAAANVL
jgi:hypothetical protein